MKRFETLPCRTVGLFDLCSLGNTVQTLQSLRTAIGLLQDNQPLFHYVIACGISGSYLAIRNLTLQTCLSITQEFFHLYGTFAQLYDAATLPASHLRYAGSLAITAKLIVQLDTFHWPFSTNCPIVVSNAVTQNVMTIFSATRIFQN